MTLNYSFDEWSALTPLQRRSALDAEAPIMAFKVASQSNKKVPPVLKRNLQSGDLTDFLLTTEARNAGAIQTNRLQLYPILVTEPVVVSRLGVVIGTSVAGALGKILLFSRPEKARFPGTKVYESSELDFNSAPGYLYTPTIPGGLIMLPNIYYVGLYTNGTGANLHRVLSGGWTDVGNSRPDQTSKDTCLIVSSVYPADIPSNPTVALNGAFPALVHFEIA